MNILKVLKFLFPEYQIVESFLENGFIGKKPRKVYQPNQYYNVNASPSSNGNYQTQSYSSGATNNSYGNANPSNNAATPNDTVTYTGNNTVNPTSYEVNEAFTNLSNELANRIVGQANSLNNLAIAFKRPFVAGYNLKKPRNSMFIIGDKSTGRHKCLKEIVKALYKKGMLNYDNATRLDLSLYPTASEQPIFLSDLYKGLYKHSDILVIDNFEKCSNNVISAISSLVIDGEYKLNARYAVQNNTLIEATGALMQNSVSALSANGKFFVFVTDQSESKIAEVFGSKFMTSVGDIIKMDSYTKGELVQITRKILIDLVILCKDKLSIELRYDDSLAVYFAEKYNNDKGLRAIERFIFDSVYKALAEYKLRNTMEKDSEVILSVSHEKIVAQIVGSHEKKVINLMDLLPKDYSASKLEEVKEELNSVIGLKKVKDYVLDLENNFKVQKMREDSGYKAAEISKHMIFTGNPGTGKTTIARIVAKYLKAIGVLSTGQLREVTRADLVAQYVGHTAKQTNEVVRSAIGGVLFIDEAYSLCRDKNDTFGLEAIDALVKAIEDNRDDLVVILAGYKDEMEGFLNTNSGLKSRFPNIIDFEDYTAEEMHEIALITAKSKGYKIATGCKESLIRVFDKSQIKGRNDSGNGRLVRNYIESAILEQSKRLIKDLNSQMDLLVYEDFKFEDYEKFDLDKALSEIIGLESVKDFVRTQYNLLVANEKRRKAGIELDTTQSLNMIFSGNPGTGKTTIARVVASMFKEMGLLKKGHLVETDRGGLVAQYQGQTAVKTEEVFKSALGGVLFIDEAYSLTSDGNSYGKEAIDTLVKLIEDYRGEIVVILAGYKKEMADFIKVNSGLESRFPLLIDFPDYSAKELYEIALRMIYSKGFQVDETVKERLFEEIQEMQKTSTAHSGNGRMARNFVEKIIRNQSARIASEDVTIAELNKILLSDMINTVDSNRTEAYDLDKALNKIIGLDEVKSYIRSLHARLRLQSERKKMGMIIDNSQTLHMIFKGNPGTGKTMVARTVADVLYNIGVIRTNKLVETDRASLVAGYVGQTAIKTTEKVMEAMDGVLFIDEAYSLANGGANDFGREAIDTLVKLMDDHRERLVVILAGYSKDMDDFLNTNAGLKSRFPNIIEFADYNVQELMEIAKGFYKGKGYELTQEAENKLSGMLGENLKEESFGNGRYVRNIIEKSVNNQALRLSTDMDLTREELTVIEVEDIERM